MQPGNPDKQQIIAFKWNTNWGAWETQVELFPKWPILFVLMDEEHWATTDMKDLVGIGTEFITWARQFESQCRERIADDLLGIYNRSWAVDDPKEGTPTLARPQFLAALSIKAISLHEEGSSSWDYDCGDLFAGHSISLMLRKDRSFAGKASLVG
jgi:hypothetical protein